MRRVRPAPVGRYAAPAEKVSECRSRQQRIQTATALMIVSKFWLNEHSATAPRSSARSGQLAASGGRVSLVVKVAAGRGLVPVLGSHHQSGGSGGDVAPPACRHRCCSRIPQTISMDSAVVVQTSAQSRTTAPCYLLTLSNLTQIILYCCAGCQHFSNCNRNVSQESSG